MEQIISLLAVAVSLSMDAFAVSVCKGLSAPCWKPSNGVRAALYFGGFQMLMPLIGYFLGARFRTAHHHGGSAAADADRSQYDP